VAVKLKLLTADRLKALGSFAFFAMCVAIIARHLGDAVTEISNAASARETGAPESVHPLVEVGSQVSVDGLGEVS